MKKFEVEILLYPQKFTVEAETEVEAVQKAKEQFYEKNNNASIYSVESVTQDFS